MEKTFSIIIVSCLIGLLLVGCSGLIGSPSGTELQGLTSTSTKPAPTYPTIPQATDPAIVYTRPRWIPDGKPFAADWNGGE